jgi:hypothetical protein
VKEPIFMQYKEKTNYLYLFFATLCLTSLEIFVMFPIGSFAATHCLVVVGQGAYQDKLYPIASPFLKQAPIKGTCKEFNTWKDLYGYFNTHRSSFSEEDQFFITQAVHGAPGGRGFDCEGEITDPSHINSKTTLEQIGGTGPQEIIDILEDMASQNRVAYHNMSCHGGSLLTTYLQKHNSSSSVDEIQSRLCIVTESIQGAVTTVRHNISWPELNLSGLSMADVFKMEVSPSEDNPSNYHVPLIQGLISSARMSVLTEHESIRSNWEGGQSPMVVHHSPKDEKSWTGAYQGCRFEADTSYPIWGLDSHAEQVYKLLDASEGNAGRPSPHQTSIESLDLPPLNAREELRRQACDQFKF